MRNRPLAGVLALSLSWAGAVLAQQAPSQSLERVEVAGRKAEASEWFRAESPHFIVYSDTREEDVALLLDNLEKLDQLLRIYTQPESRADVARPKLTLHHHSRRADIGRVDGELPVDAITLYSSCAAGAQGFGLQLERMSSLEDGQLARERLNDTLSAAFEAYARHYLHRHTDIRAPAWVIEGFAQYFSTVRFSAGQMVVGRAPRAVADYLRFLGEGRRYSLEYEDVLRNDLANGRSPGGSAGVGLEFQARSWLLTHYVMASDDRRKRLSRYLAVMEGGASPTAAFELVFGIKLADLGELLWRHGLSRAEVLRVQTPVQPVPPASFRSLSRAQGELVLLEAGLKSCPGKQAGEALLAQLGALAARYPADARVRLALSRAEVDWGDPRLALPRLEALLREDGARAEARYLLGVAQLRLSGREGGAALQQALRQLRQSRDLNPASPEVVLAAFKAELAAVEVPADEALQSLVSAWQGARDVTALARFAALAQAFMGRVDEASRTLAVLAVDPHDPASSSWAGEWQGRLQAGVTRRDILAEMRREAAPTAPLKAWTLDKEAVMQKVRLAYGLEEAEHYIKEQREQQQGGAQQRTEPGAAMTPR